MTGQMRVGLLPSSLPHTVLLSPQALLLLIAPSNPARYQVLE